MHSTRVGVVAVLPSHTLDGTALAVGGRCAPVCREVRPSEAPQIGDMPTCAEMPFEVAPLGGPFYVAPQQARPQTPFGQHLAKCVAHMRVDDCRVGAIAAIRRRFVLMQDAAYVATPPRRVGGDYGLAGLRVGVSMLHIGLQGGVARLLVIEDREIDVCHHNTQNFTSEPHLPYSPLHNPVRMLLDGNLTGGY